MATPIISDEASDILQLFHGISGLILEGDSGFQERAVKNIILDAIKEVEKVMNLPTVRGHQDPYLHDEVGDDDDFGYVFLSLDTLLRRLRHRIQVVRQLADLAHAGPPANDDERNALDQVKQILRTKFRNVSTEICSKKSISRR